MSSIIVSELEYGPPGSDQLFFDVSFKVTPGEHAAIVGANGVGKSTILRILSAQIEADGGERGGELACRAGRYDRAGLCGMGRDPSHGEGGGGHALFAGEACEIGRGLVHPVLAVARGIHRVFSQAARPARGVFAGEEAAAEGRIGADGHALIHRHGQDLDLGLPFDEVVHGLDHVDPRAEALRHCLRLHHLPRGIVRHADMADLPRLLQLGEGREGFLKLGLIVPAVEVEKIDLVHPKLASADVELGADVLAPAAARVGHFGGEEDLVALGPDKAAEELFRLALGIAHGGIEVVEAGSAGGVIHPAAFHCIGAPAELHRAKGEAICEGAGTGGEGGCHGGKLREPGGKDKPPGPVILAPTSPVRTCGRLSAFRCPSR